MDIECRAVETTCGFGRKQRQSNKFNYNIHDLSSKEY